MLDLSKIKKGEMIQVAVYPGKIGNVEFQNGGFHGKFINKIDDELIMIYSNGYRPVKIKHCSIMDEDIPIATVSGGKMIISCIECGNDRTIKKCDVHHVKRCVSCQKKYAREQTKLRMRKKRAEAKKKDA